MAAEEEHIAKTGTGGDKDDLTVPRDDQDTVHGGQTEKGEALAPEHLDQLNQINVMDENTFHTLMERSKHVRQEYNVSEDGKDSIDGFESSGRPLKRGVHNNKEEHGRRSSSREGRSRHRSKDHTHKAPKDKHILLTRIYREGNSIADHLANMSSFTLVKNSRGSWFEDFER